MPALVNLQIKRSIARVLYFLLLLLFSFTVNAQEIIQLYTDSIPNSKKSEKKETFNGGIYRGVTKPALEVYLPEKEKATGTAVVICPGGSYAVLVYQGEGITTAKELVKNGIACFILKYRLPDDSIMRDKKIGPLQDAQQAIKVVRENAAKWGIDKNKIGIMGFSAGGHLSAALSNIYEKRLYEPVDEADKLSCRPDFSVVIYPGYLAVADQNFAPNPEIHPTMNTPPTLIVQAEDDPVHVENSLVYYRQLKDAKVPAELHIYAKGGHGYGLRKTGNPVAVWPQDVERWLHTIRVLGVE